MEQFIRLKTDQLSDFFVQTQRELSSIKEKRNFIYVKPIKPKSKKKNEFYWKINEEKKKQNTD